MLRLDLTLSTAVANVALDEALLESAEASQSHPEMLRLWHPQAPLVVLGRSSPLAAEVDVAYCQEQGIPVVRRCSGGQTVVSGPGCLMYAVLLDYRRRPELRMLDEAHRFVMTRMQAAVAGLGIEALISGTSDLTVNGRKVSGNSMRCKRNWMIYHGTMLCGLSVDLIARCLRTPVRQPEYRRGRSHLEFLAQLETTPSQLSQAIAKQWQAEPEEFAWPRQRTEQLVAEKYSQAAWTAKLP